MFFSRKINQFFAVATCQSLVKAAEQTRVTPSALRHGINELESQLGKSLIKRSKNGMDLTPAGKSLYNRLYPYYEKIRKIENQIMNSNEENTSLCIKLDGLYYPDLKTKLLEIRQENNRYKLSLEDGCIDNINEELFDKEFDLVISSLEFDYSYKKINAINLCTQKVGLLVNKKLIEKYPDTKTFFAKETLIQRSSSLQNPIFTTILERLKNKGYQYHTLGLTEMADVLHCVDEGEGYCFIPENIDYISTITNDEVQFIRSPFPFDFFLHQKVYFKKENNKNLADIAMTLR
ncbi:LysR family transcriptional regulator [Proteus penneri]|uniref:DNA-binding transcriptional activator GcvA n=1 Tax=Proteus penneri TaxID=102862 RepID=A0A0G4QDW6_9GAMM|nr:LysR family transcriptional regulator [Proteus penneri]CRL63794.1 DNA-binding transcriptional activator GcvA [Proteus penneri]